MLKSNLKSLAILDRSPQHSTKLKTKSDVIATAELSHGALLVFKAKLE